jgi:hypothetical protein
MVTAAAAGVLEFVSTGEYRDERLFLLESVKRQEKKLDATVTEVAVVKAENVKLITDLNRLGGVARGLTKDKDSLQKRILRMEIRAGSIAAVAGIFTATALELIFRYLVK